MTDTTKDIAAMRESIAKAYEGVGPETVDIYVKTLESILDKFERAQRRIVKLSSSLEAERQRADGASFRENHLNEMLNDKLQQNSDLRLELAALKGEQVPDGYVKVPAKANIAMIRAGGKAAREYMEEYGGNSPQVIYQAMIAAAPLHTAPQKPVISKEKLCDWLEDEFDIPDSKRDVLATDFAKCCECVVKDGD